jgi:hypothetical protein
MFSSYLQRCFTFIISKTVNAIIAVRLNPGFQPLSQYHGMSFKKNIDNFKMGKQNTIEK